MSDEKPFGPPDGPAPIEDMMEPWFRVPPGVLGPHCPTCSARIPREGDVCPQCARQRSERHNALTAAFIRAVGIAFQDLTEGDVFPLSLRSRLGHDARRVAMAMLDAPERLLTERRTVVVGPHGSGKSTVARAFFEMAFRVARTGDAGAFARATRARAIWANDITDPLSWDQDVYRDARGAPWLLIDNIGVAPDPRERVRSLLEERATRGLPTICAVDIPTMDAFAARWGAGMARLLFEAPSVLVNLGPTALAVRR